MVVRRLGTARRWTLRSLAAASAFITVAALGQVPAFSLPPLNDGATLLFADDFNDNHLDPAKWSVTNSGYGVTETGGQIRLSVREQSPGETEAGIRSRSIPATFGGTRGIDVGVRVARMVQDNGAYVAQAQLLVTRADDPSKWVVLAYHPYYSLIYFLDSTGNAGYLSFSQQPTGFHDVRLAITGSDITGYYDGESRTTLSTVFAGATAVRVELKDVTGGSSPGLWETSARDDLTVYSYVGPPGFACAKTAAVDGGWRHALALQNDGTVWGWGENIQGGVGDGTFMPKAVPTQVKGLSGVTKVSAGGNFSLALRDDGTVWAWGDNSQGQLGNATRINNAVAAPVAGLSGVVGISAGGSHAMALRADGTVWVWGENGAYQLGNGTTTDLLVPTQMDGLSGITAVTAGQSHSLALKSDGTVLGWGWNVDGEVGAPKLTQRRMPYLIPGLTNVVQLAAGWGLTYALRSNGTVLALGQNWSGQLGNGTTTPYPPTPLQVSGLSGVTQIAAGGFQGFALRDDGTMWAWGDNEYNMLGDGTTETRTIPVETGTGISAVASGMDSGYALRDGNVLSWGAQFFGMLGTNTPEDHPVPMPVYCLVEENLNTAPTTELVSPAQWATLSQGTPYTFRVVATDPEDDVVSAVVTLTRIGTNEAFTLTSPQVASGEPAWVTFPPSLPAGQYTWTAHAVDGWGAVGPDTATRTVTLGTCPGDSDCDGIADLYEIRMRTSLTNPDTDGDGLSDSLEAPLWATGNGMNTASGVHLTADEVLGPFDDCSTQPDYLGRYTKPTSCLNHRPDPLRKDVYVELDWQDCKEGGCFEAPGVQPLPYPLVGVTINKDLVPMDTMHHAPSATGLQDAVALYGKAPVPTTISDPGVTLTAGVQLNINVDEAVTHSPNCVKPDYQRPNFGTAAQHKPGNAKMAEALAIKRNLVRYMYSGHSVREDKGSCPLPDDWEILLSGAGLRDLPDYDVSPFGMVAQHGDLVVMSIGPVWACGSHDSEDIFLNLGAIGDTGPCFRGLAPGIYPAKIEGKEYRNPIHLLLGEKEKDAVRQLWSRGLTRELGIALGVPASQVGNDPAPTGRRQDSPNHPLTPLLPQAYGSWSGVKYTPQQVTNRNDPEYQPHREPPPDYDTIQDDDPDNDGDMSRHDNCPTVYNPNQHNVDASIWVPLLPDIEWNTDDQGDACDPDIDGDKQLNPLPGDTVTGAAMVGGGAGSMAMPLAAPTYDPYPYDTNNDGEDNDVDADDDGDGVADSEDNCVLTANDDQANRDGDHLGDGCDADADGDGLYDPHETLLHSDPLNGASTPEYAHFGDSCGNGVDDDADGSADSADTGCADADDDGFADADDRCPARQNLDNGDDDGDGVGDPCDVVAKIESVTPSTVGVTDAIVSLAFSTRVEAAYEVRLGGSDCTTGEVIGSGTHTPSTETSVYGYMDIEAMDLPEGTSALRLCVTAHGETVEDTASVVRDTTVPVVGPPMLTAVTDTGTSSTDGVTNATALALGGVTEAGATVVVFEGDVALGTVIADDAGAWELALDGERPEGIYSFTALAVDEVGNVSATSPEGTVRVDRTAPVTALTGGPAEGSEVPHAPVTFTFSADEAATSECSLDDGAWEACTSPHDVNADPGSHTLRVRSTDVAGNVESAGVARTWSVLYTFTGFYAPVDNQPTLNTMKAGAAVPVKFSLGGNWGIGILAAGSPSTVAVSCSTSAPLSEVEETLTAGNSALHYDATADRYVYTWKTNAAWAGTCRELRVKLRDGKTYRATFKFR